MNKRLITFIMVLVLAVSVTVPAFAATYSDLTDHWAKTYMEELAEKGYLTGYSDGTMKPDKDITYCETLTLLSRLYSLSDIQKEKIESDYGTVVKAQVPSTLSWAYENIEICLAANIISESELKSIDLTANIEKQTLSVYLVRALQLTDAADALSGVDLNFDDAASVTSYCVGSIAELVTIGVVKGDDDNNFSPTSNVTRAVVATMFSRSLNYLDTKNITLEIKDYAGLSTAEGIIYSVNSDTFVLTGYNGLRTEYSISSSTDVTVNGVAKDLGTGYVGCYAAVTMNNDGIKDLAITNGSSIEWVQGELTIISTSTDCDYLTVKDVDSSEISTYKVPVGVTVTKDGANSAIASLITGDFVSVKYVDGTATEVYSESGDATISGTVSEMKYGTTTTLNVVDDNGDVYCFYFSISNLPEITRDGYTVTVDRIKAGTTVSIAIEDCEVATITLSASESTVSGKLTSTTTTSDGTVWTIKADDDNVYSYTLDDDAVAYNGTTEVDISDIAIGDTVSVVVYDDTISEITVSYLANSSTKVSGSVIYVDTSEKQIIVLTDTDKMVYIDATYLVTVIDTSTGYSTYYSSIAEDSNIVAYGTYTDSRHFKATSIIIE